MDQPPQPRALLDWLKVRFPGAKRETFKQMLAHGRLRVNGATAKRLSQIINPGDEVRVVSRDQARQAALPSLHPLKRVHEDDDLLVIEKPAGLLTSTVAKERRP